MEPRRRPLGARQYPWRRRRVAAAVALSLIQRTAWAWVVPALNARSSQAWLQAAAASRPARQFATPERGGSWAAHRITAWQPAIAPWRRSRRALAAAAAADAAAADADPDDILRYGDAGNDSLDDVEPPLAAPEEPPPEIAAMKRRRGRPRREDDADSLAAEVAADVKQAGTASKPKKPRRRKKKGPEFSFLADGRVLDPDCRGHLVVVHMGSPDDLERCRVLRDAVADRFGGLINFHDEVMDEEGANCFEVWLEGPSVTFLHSRQRQLDGELEGDAKVQEILEKIADGISDDALLTYGPF